MLLSVSWTLASARENIEAGALLWVDEQVADEAAEEAAEQAAQKAQEAAEKAAERAAEEAQEAAEEAAEQAAAKAQEAAEEAAEQAAEEAQEAAEEAAEQAAEEAQEAAEEAAEKAAEEAQEAAEKAAEQAAEEAQEEAEEAAEQAAEEAQEEAEEAAEQAAEEAQEEAEEAAEQAAEEAQEEAEEAAEQAAEDAEEDASEESENEYERGRVEREYDRDDELAYIANLSAERLRITDENFYENEIDAISNELLILTDDKASLKVEKSNYSVQEQIYLKGLDLVLTRIKTPSETSTSQSLSDVTMTLEQGDVDLNHLYDLEAQELSEPDAVVSTTDFSKIMPSTGVQNADIKLGLIDTQINQSHSALMNQHIVMKDFVPYEGIRPEAHGTSVASILVGNEPPNFKGIIPKAKLFAASVFFDLPSGEVAATTESLILAMDWLVQQEVPVINMSLSGPENKLLEIATTRVMEKGTAIVAAVGNAGPNTKPLYPAAYEGVVAVTAVDENHQVYLRANRGDYVTFAARGVDILAAKASGGYHRQTGTSIAAPFVSAILTNITDTEKKHTYLKRLKENAIDLGPPGFDEIYGYGLIQAISE